MNSPARPFARTDRSLIANWWWTVDRGVLMAVLVLIVLGVALSFGSSPAAAQASGISDDPFYFAWRMVMFAAAGLTIMFGASLLSPRGVRRIAVLTLLGSLFLMMLLPLIGDNVKGATRWISVGPFGLQPSEMVKPAFIVFAAWMFSESQKGQGIPGITIAFVTLLIIIGLLYIQPDIGQTLLIVAVFGAVFFMAGVPLKWMGVMLGAAVAGGAAIYATVPHVRDRVARFTSPDQADTYQIDRASEAIAAGGLVGRGAGEGVMKRSVPDLHTDFIYSVAAEEFGLIFSLLLIGLYAFIVLRGMSRALRLYDPFEQTAAAGLFMLLGLQAVINVAVNLNLIPTKGMTLPFISYGGSSMIGMALTMGFALALTRRRAGAFDPGESPLFERLRRGG